MYVLHVSNYKYTPLSRERGVFLIHMQFLLACQSIQQKSDDDTDSPNKRSRIGKKNLMTTTKKLSPITKSEAVAVAKKAKLLVRELCVKC